MDRKHGRNLFKMLTMINDYARYDYIFLDTMHYTMFNINVYGTWVATPVCKRCQMCEK